MRPLCKGSYKQQQIPTLDTCLHSSSRLVCGMNGRDPGYRLVGLQQRKPVCVLCSGMQQQQWELVVCQPAWLAAFTSASDR